MFKILNKGYANHASKSGFACTDYTHFWNLFATNTKTKINKSKLPFLGNQVGTTKRKNKK